MLFESFWRRGLKGTIQAANSFPGFLIEVGGTALVGVLTTDPWITIYYLVLVLFLLWVIATASAPYRQRNEARAEVEMLRAELDMKRSQATTRRLSATQKSILADVIGTSGVRPDPIYVLFDHTDPECHRFAMDVSDAIEQADYSVEMREWALDVGSSRERGVKIVSRKMRSLKPLVDSVFEALTSMGFSRERRTDPEIETLQIRIAKAPED